MIEIDPEMTVGKDKVLVKTGAEMITEEMGTCNILVEIMAETEAEILTETIVVTAIDQEKEDYLLEGIIIIIIIINNNNNNRQNANYRFRSRFRSRSHSRVRTNRDRVRCYRC